jgi:hypothetical protein
VKKHDYAELVRLFVNEVKKGVDPIVPVNRNELKPVRLAFQNSINRITSLLLLGSYCTIYTRLDQYVVDQAALDLYGRLMTVKQFRKAEYAFKLHAEQYSRLHDMWEKTIGADQGKAAKIGAIHAALSTHPKITDGLTAVIDSIPLWAWTAFEVLSEDLWVAAVNADHSLATRYASATGKQIEVSALGAYGKHDFNLSTLMGDVLRGKAEFDTLENTHTTYRRTFGVAFPMLQTPHLRLLALVRNLIIHNAGRVDRKFLENIKKANLREHLGGAKIELNTPFPLTARMALKLFLTVETCGGRLLALVDSRMK